jgi:hypothetical protein
MGEGVVVGTTVVLNKPTEPTLPIDVLPPLIEEVVIELLKENEICTHPPPPP